MRKTVFAGPLLYAVLAAGLLIPGQISGQTTSSSAGVQVWRQTWAGIKSAGAPIPVAARELADGSNMVVGCIGGGWDLQDLVAVRFDHGGNVLSTASFFPPFFSLFTSQPPNASLASLVTIDPYGGIFVASESNVSRSGSNVGDIWLWKYDGLTGKPLWPAPVIFDGPSHQQDIPVSLLLDPQGNLVLVGQSRNSTLYSMVVFKYEGASGRLLWGPATIAGAANRAAAVDPSGNIFISSGATVGKLDGQTGLLAWGMVTSGVSISALDVSPDGNVVVAGAYSNDIRTAKLSGATGSLLWGPSVFTQVSNPSLWVTGVNVGVSGDVVVSGTGGGKFLLLKYSGGDGSLIWGPQGATAATGAAGLTIRLAANGDVISSGSNGSNQVAIWRYSGSNGISVWGPETDGGNTGDYYRRPTVLLCSNGRILSATVHSDGTNSSLEVIEREPAAGEIAWASPFQAPGETESYPASVTQGPDGSVFVSGYTQYPNNLVTFKYSRSDGKILWGPVYYGVPSDQFAGKPYAIRTDASGDLFVLGGSVNATVLKYSGATGDLLWGPVSLTSVSPWWMTVDSSGDVLVLGSVNDGIYPAQNYDLAVFKLSGATGSLLWAPVFFDGGLDDYPVSIAVTPGDDVVVTGSSRTPLSSQWVTLKYSGSTGALLWGPSVLADSSGIGPSDVLVDPTGNVIVFGTADAHMATIKYDGATGAVLWGPKTVSGSENYYDYAEAAVIDTAGDVFVTGGLYNTHGGSSINYDFGTVKYRGSDGALLWGPQQFNGSGDGSDVAYAIGLDLAGNPVVAGTSRNAALNKDIALLKYDGATGALLWGPVMAGSPGDDNLPWGNLVVRGTSAVIAGQSAGRFLTAAYGEVFGIQTLPEDVPPAYCENSYSMTLLAANATGAVTWSIASGTLPPGLSLNAATGEIAGTPTTVGSFSFRVQVQDSQATTGRDFVIDVYEGSGFVPILSTSNPVCLGQSTTLSVPGSWTSYQWLTGGETTATISVSPGESTDYGVVLTDSAGCLVRGYTRISVGALGAQTPSAGNNGPVCAGQTLQLTASSVSGAAYSWTGPNGFASAEQNPQILSAPASASGLYRVTVTVNGCQSAPAATAAVVNALPSAAISATASICSNTSSTASVPSAGAGATYDWTIVNGTITAGTGTSTITFTAGASGSVQLGVTVTDADGCSATGSKTVSITSGALCPGFYTVTPCRVIDTRYPDGPLAGPSLSGGTQRTFVLPEACGIPATATAVSVNIAVTQAEGSGHLIVYPGGASPPDVSVINFNAGDTRSNNAILVLGGSGDITVYTAIGSGLQVDFILDVNGYFQ